MSDKDADIYGKCIALGLMRTIEIEDIPVDVLEKANKFLPEKVLPHDGSVALFGWLKKGALNGANHPRERRISKEVHRCMNLSGRRFALVDNDFDPDYKRKLDIQSKEITRLNKVIDRIRGAVSEDQ